MKKNEVITKNSFLCEVCGDKLKRYNERFCCFDCEKKYYERIELNYEDIIKLRNKWFSKISYWKVQVRDLKKEVEQYEKKISNVQEYMRHEFREQKMVVVCEQCGSNERVFDNDFSYCLNCGKRRLVNQIKKRKR